MTGTYLISSFPRKRESNRWVSISIQRHFPLFIEHIHNYHESQNGHHEQVKGLFTKTSIWGIVDFGIGGLGITILGALGTYDVKSK